MSTALATETYINVGANLASGVYVNDAAIRKQNTRESKSMEVNHKTLVSKWITAEK